MGSFYNSIVVCGPTREELLESLRRRRRTAYITPTRNEITVIYDRECDELDPNTIADLTEGLSGEFACPVLAACNYDDDLLWLLLFVNGELQVDYVSRGGQLTGANALCRAFGRSLMLPTLWIVLHLPIVVFEMFRHWLAAKCLGLPATWVAFGYRNVEQDLRDVNVALPDLAFKDLLHTRRRKDDPDREKPD